MQGELDLQNLTPREEAIFLNGNWEFYPEKFLLQEDEFQSSQKEKIFLPVPGNWNEIFRNGCGYGTFRLKVKLPNHWIFPISLKLFEQGTAYRLFVNKEEIAKNGIVGRTKQETKPLAFPLVTHPIPPAFDLEIIAHVSNFHFREGGLWYPILLGNEKVLLKEREKNLNLDMFLLGSILIMGVYHTALYFIRKKDTSSLWFGFFCFDIIFRLLSFNEKYINTLIPDLPYVWATRIEYWGYYFAVPLFAQFLYSIFPSVILKKIVSLIWIITLPFCVLVLATGSEIFTHSAPYFHICTMFSSICFLFVIGKALVQKKESAFLLFLGTSALIAGTLNDILYSMEYIKTIYLVPQALLFFIFIQSLLLSVRFSKAFTENEKLTIELSDLNQSLEKKVTERTLEFRLEKEKVEKVSKIKDKFVSIVSHDLRTPMIGISNLLEILKTQKYVSEPKERESLIQICYDSVQHSLTMIKQLLNFSRIETGVLKLNYDKVEFKKYLQSNLADSFAQAKLKNITIQIDIEEPDLISIDPEIFSHALKNLIGNSIKFTNSNGVIQIRSFQNGNNFQIEIEDNGIGISPEKLEELFNPEKVKSSLGTKGEAGFGMGLFICKYIVDAHNGKIEFHSKEKEGLHCKILLPIDSQDSITQR